MAEYRTVTVVATVSNNVFNADGTVTTNSFDVTADGQQVVVVDPYIYVEQTDEGAVVTAVDTRGSTQATIYNGQDGQDGVDGVSPGVAVSSITGGHAVTITDAEHPTGQTFNVMDGQDGSDGQDGQDGISPGVTVTDFTGGHTVTITDADHPGGQSFNVFNGQNGIDGQDGSDGQDGVSPAVTISSITGGHRVNITDADHPTGQNFDVMDGTAGPTGPPGPINLGITGADAGDLITVKTVDSDGAPTAWEPIDMPPIAVGSVDTALVGNDLAGNTASGAFSSAFGESNTVSGDDSFSTGRGNTVTGNRSFAFGYENTVTGATALAIGRSNTCNRSFDIALGYGNVCGVQDGGTVNTAIGYNNTATGAICLTIGQLCKATAQAAIALGYNNTASGLNSHAEGHSSVASGQGSFAGGQSTTCSGNWARTDGSHTIAKNSSQMVFGMYNVADPSTNATNQRGEYVEIVGNGTADNARSNARTLDWNGNETLAGKLTLGAGPTANMDAATKGYVDGAVPTTYAGSATAGGTASRAEGIPFGAVDSTSTSTAYTATVPGITELKDGTVVMLKNGVVTSASGFTLDINGLGAKPVYNSMATGNSVTPTVPSREATTFNINYTLLLVYSTDLVDGGAWINYRGYNSDNNTIGYQLRTNSSTMPMDSVTYRYRLLFTKADGTKWVPANNSTSTNATASRTTIQTPIDPFGEIVYYSSTAIVAADANPGVAYLWQQYAISLGYSFNRTGAALVLQYPKPVYLKCAPQTNGSAIIDADTPYVQALPSSADGKIYIYLGRAYSATNIELTMKHPVYEYKDGAIRLWTNAASGGGGTSDYTDLTNKPSINSVTLSGNKTASDLGLAVPVTVTNVPGASVTLTGVAETRYICGTLDDLTFTPPASGIVDIVFTSGATATVLSLPNTVNMPEWFSVEANRIYEINIMDGIYGAVMSWPV